MKKLITGAVAALALLFSFASCSGDLHENDVQPLYIAGEGASELSWTLADHHLTLANSDGSEQTYTFTATASAINFKLSSSTSWNDDFGGSDTEVYYAIVNNSDYLTLFSRVGEGKSNTNNVVINDVTVGEKYSLTVKYDSASYYAAVKVSGSAVVMPALNIVLKDGTTSKNFPAKDSSGNELTYTMTRAGTSYTYQFIAKETEDISFHLESATAELTYGGATIGATDTDLTAYDDTDMTVSVTKNHEYKLTVSVPKLTTATIKAEEVSMLKNTAIYANWKYAENFYEVEAKDNSKTEVSYLFSPENTSLEFVVNRVAGADYPTWGAGTTSSVAVDGSDVELKYFDGEKDDNGKIKEEKKNVKVTGLKAGTWYYLNLKVDNDTFTFNVNVTTASYTDLTKHAVYVIESSTTDKFTWSNVLIEPEHISENSTETAVTPTAVKVSDSEYYFDVDLTGKTLTTGYVFAVILDSSWWGNRYEMSSDETYTVGTKTKVAKLTENREKDGRGIIKLEAKKYKLTVTLEGPVAYFEFDEQ